MVLTNLNAEFVACVLLLQKITPQAESGKYKFLNMVFSPQLGTKSGSLQIILDSLFACLGSAPIGDRKKGEFMDWTRGNQDHILRTMVVSLFCAYLHVVYLFSI